MLTGPQPVSNEVRMDLAKNIAERALSSFGERVECIALYGSTARGTSGPYSDIEMMCILNTVGEDFSREWVAGTWKAEVNFMSKDIVFAEAGRLEGNWPLTHGQFANTLGLYDPDGLLPILRRTVFDHSAREFDDVVRELIIGEIYECIGKVRNALYFHNYAAIPAWTVELARYGAMLTGLANRSLYTTGARIFEESFSLADKPKGYEELCRLVMEGNLSDSSVSAATCEDFWDGVDKWVNEHGIVYVSEDRVPF